MNAIRSRLLLGACGALLMSVSAFAQGGIVGSFPNPVHPTGNQTNPAKVALGKMLFWDEQLSSDSTMACGTCHFPEAGGADIHAGARHPGPGGIFGDANDLFGSPGMLRQDVNGDYINDNRFGASRLVTNRNAPTVINAAFFRALFWNLSADESFEFENGTVVPGMGMNAGLESQVVAPPVSVVEMAHEMIDWAEIEAKLISAQPLALASNIPAPLATRIVNANRQYEPLFFAAFGPVPIMVGESIITRERIAMAIATYMRTLVSDMAPFDTGMMTADEQAGFGLFQQANCTSCHSLSSGIFSDGQLHNIDLPNHSRNVKTPTLRNIGLRRRFMHSGQFSTLDELVAFYNTPNPPPPFSQNLRFNPPLNPTQQMQFKAFLENALTDPRVAAAQPPFDRPTLASEVTPFDSNIYGSGSVGSGGFEPKMLANSPASILNDDFKLGLGEALGSTTAALGLSTAAAPMGAMTRGVPLNIDLTPGVLARVVNVPVTGAGNGEGSATFRLASLIDPSLVGQSFFAQWFVLDPAGPQGFVSTKGATFTIF